MSILIIGGAGYIGSHIYHCLKDQKQKVIVLDNLTTGHAHFVNPSDLIVGDFADQSLLKEILASHSIDTVMHFAALSIVEASIRQPLAYYHHNLAKTLLLLTTLTEFPVKHFIFSSTAAVYGHPEYLPIDIQHTTKPINPYGMSKLAIEHLLEYFAQNYGINYAILRYFNAAGADSLLRCGEKHQPETHLIPRILQAALNNTSVYIYGDQHQTRDGTCERDYIHVSDLANAHYLALKQLKENKISKIYNLGTGRGYTVKEVIKSVETVIGRSLQVEVKHPRPGDPAILIAKPDYDFAWQCQYSHINNIIADAWKWEQLNAQTVQEKELFLQDA